jgi:Ca2+-dependent lipid-binding protein
MSKSIALTFFLVGKPIGVVRLSLWEARDLRNVEAVTRGKSDPYVRVVSGSQVRARTQVIDNNLSPEWGEFHYIPVHGMREDLTLEVMDWNAKTKDKLLGTTTLRMKDLIHEFSGPKKDDPNRWYEQREKIDQ